MLGLSVTLVVKVVYNISLGVTLAHLSLSVWALTSSMGSYTTSALISNDSITTTN